MRKEKIKQYRNKAINDFWDEHKADWEMKDVAYLFNLSLPQIYRILKEKKQRSEIK